MEKYDYKQCVIDDVKEKLDEWFDYNNIEDYSDMDELVNAIQDDFFVDDAVTGNASGSYTFNTWRAEENLCHNMDLLEEALNEFGGNVGEYVERGAETCDVTIRCYLLGQIIYDVVEKYVEDKFPNFEM